MVDYTDMKTRSAPSLSSYERIAAIRGEPAR